MSLGLQDRVVFYLIDRSEIVEIVAAILDLSIIVYLHRLVGNPPNSQHPVFWAAH